MSFNRRMLLLMYQIEFVYNIPIVTTKDLSQVSRF
jgi:hypothetical protein